MNLKLFGRRLRQTLWQNSGLWACLTAAGLILAGCSTPANPRPVTPSDPSKPAVPEVEIHSKTAKLLLPNGQEVEVNTGETDWTQYIAAVKALPAAGLDAPPEPIHLVLPAYPLALQAAGIQGSATVEFIIGLDGRVTKMRLVSFTHPEFALAATQAIAQWKFKPARINGKAVSIICSQEIPFEFRSAKKS